ncbi:MAG TPA: N-acetylmuramidase family protein [Pyrinomonadaceae bacterium]|nr:N-acetylmuramidase family protein [Pyrinomonadaceae bacterium]
MPVLKIGSSGPEVSNLQQRLKELGFDPNGVDGNFGPGTQAALIAFQKAKGLEPDGKAGPNTLAALNLNGNQGSATGTTGTTTATVTTGTAGAAGAGAAAAVSKLLNEDDYKQAAEQLNCEIAAIKAVAEVESRGAGFLPDGRPKILFERHKFHAFTGGKFDASHPDISNKKAGGYGMGGAHQWDRFNEAFALNPNAAIKACSWGKFQVMGFNFNICGFENLDDFRAAMSKSEGEHLKAFCCFIDSTNLAGALRNKKWAKLAEGYNGADYRINKYDTKLAAAYKKYSKQ